MPKTFWDRGIWSSIKHLVLQCDPKSLVASAVCKSLRWEEFCEKEQGFLLCSRWYRAEKKRYSESKTCIRARISAGTGNQWEATTGTSTIWEFEKKKKYNSRLLAGLGMKAWNASSLFVSNQIKLTTKTRDIWPIPPGWKWLNIRRKERKKREGRGNKRKKESNNKIFFWLQFSSDGYTSFGYHG